ncbi:MAG: hypothetical protein K9G60_01105 [Pseudolabrys sp.]|nr:hypothetical protein [Pseudolabrys sp.]
MNNKTVLMVFLCAMLAMVGGSIYLAATTERAEKSIVAVAAPDGKYKAVRLTVSGDQPVPFCVDTIAIFLSVYPDSFVASESKYGVYGASCAEPAKRKDLPKIEWTANNAVRITYAPAPSSDKKPRLRTKDASLFVDITYVNAE